MRDLLTATMIGLGLLVVTPGTVKADTLRVFDVEWSGAVYSNNATASGTITLDLSLMNNPGTNLQFLAPFVTDFTVTVTGATTGDGTFTFADYNGASGTGGFDFNTSGFLDFSKQLVGQQTPTGVWGTADADANDGDFNIWSNGNNPLAPSGEHIFAMRSGGSSGDLMYLSSFAPAAVAVPEPSTLVLGSLAGLLGLGLAWRGRRMT